MFIMEDIFNYAFIINLDKTKSDILQNINSIKSFNDISKCNNEVLVINPSVYQEKILNKYDEDGKLNIKIINKRTNEHFIIENIMEECHSKYIIFFDDYSKIKSNFFNQLNTTLQLNSAQDIIHVVNKNSFNNKSNFLIKDLKKDDNNPITTIQSLIIKKDAIKESSDDDFTIINRILLKTYQYLEIYCKDLFEQKTKEEITCQEFIEKLNIYDNIIESSNNKTPLFIQYTIIYDLQQNIEKTFNSQLTDEENQKIITRTSELLEKIELQVLTKNSRLKYNIRNFLIFLKNKQQYTIQITDDSLFLKTEDYLIDKLNRHKLWMDLVDIKNNHLYISGLFLTNFDNKSITINYKSKNKNDKQYQCLFRQYNQIDRKTLKILSIPWRYSYNFELKIPIEEIINKQYYFEIQYHENNQQYTFIPEIAFRIPAGLSTSSIYTINESLILYIKNQLFTLEKYTYKKLLKLELSSLRKILHDRKKGYKQAVILRLLHTITYPYMKDKQIWLFNDRPQQADDNAITLYEYSSKQQDNIKKYYTIDKDTLDYRKLKKQYKNIIVRGSFKHKLLYLYCNKHISSFVNEDYFNPFYNDAQNDYRQLYAGLTNHNRYFLQHGVTLGDVSNSIKKFNINLSLIVTSSDMERESFLKESYGYDENVIQTLGLPRYDKLRSNPIKQIVFMPTWRVKLNKDDDIFLNSKFYHQINNLLNNQCLNEFLKKEAITLKFKPHPELIKYIKYFNIPENVKIAHESYQKLFEESQLLITDYSSVAFDFAYLKKPIIYYQPTDDYHYEKGYYDFKTMGFGEIIKEEEKVVDKITEYNKNKYQMEEEYIRRVDKFFKYNDKNNSKRVYDWIDKN